MVGGVVLWEMGNNSTKTNLEFNIQPSMSEEAEI